MVLDELPKENRHNSPTKVTSIPCSTKSQLEERAGEIASRSLEFGEKEYYQVSEKEVVLEKLAEFGEKEDFL